jgi:hypothetical protein
MKVSYFAVPNGRLAGTEVAAAIGQVHKLPPKGHNVLPAAQPSPPVVHVPSALRRKSAGQYDIEADSVAVRRLAPTSYLCGTAPVEHADPAAIAAITDRGTPRPLSGWTGSAAVCCREQACTVSGPRH